MNIESFRINISAAELDDLHRRLERTRWPDEPDGVGWSYGVPLEHVRALTARWLAGFDWRAQEADLNRHPQFLTEIDGQRLHFAHVRSSRPDALPLVLIHGWPFADFRSVIDPLIEPAPQEGPAFHLVIPTLPGFGFSGPTRRPGQAATERSAKLIAELMARLGYSRYLVHGGDAGAFIAPEIARTDPSQVAGVHLNGPITIPGWEEDGSEFSERDRALLEQLKDWSGNDTSSYATIHSTRPQTLSYGLTDSPVGALAWIADVINTFSREPIDADAVLTNVSVLWFTATIGSSLRLYRESTQWTADRASSGVPTAVAIFPGDRTIRALAERQHHIVRWTEYDRGGHFAALEAPDVLIKDLREFAASL